MPILNVNPHTIRIRFSGNPQDVTVEAMGADGRTWEVVKGVRKVTLVAEAGIPTSVALEFDGHSVQYAGGFNAVKVTK